MPQFPPRYRYATDIFGDTIDVMALTREERDRLRPFRCIGCGQEMTAGLPATRTRYFAHRSLGSCARETYLHRLAKRVFLSEYSRRVKERRTFILRRAISRSCTHFADVLGIECPIEQSLEHDLVRFFPVAEAEREVHGFRADVLLSAPERSEVVLVEFVVSHASTESKMNSGLRLIEIDIESEDDITRFSTGVIDTTIRGSACSNFADKQNRGDICKGNCQTPIWYFLVYPSRKSVLAYKPARDIVRDILNRPIPYREILGPQLDDPTATYRRKTREAHFAGVSIKNCFICKYHGTDGIDNAIYCKARRASFGSNEAVACSMYRPFTTMTACDEADRRNDAYAEKRVVSRLVKHVLRPLE